MGGFLFSLFSFFLAVLVYSPAGALAANSCNDRFDRKIIDSDFTTERGLAEVAEEMGLDQNDQVGFLFLKALLALGSQDLFVDFGSGQGGVGKTYLANGKATELLGSNVRWDPSLKQGSDARALMDQITAMTPQQKATYVGITVSSKAGRGRDAFRLAPGLNLSRWAQENKLRTMEGRFLEEIPDSEIPRAQVALDFFGALSYGKNPIETLQRQLDALGNNGTLFVFASDVFIHIGNNKTVPIAFWLASVLAGQCEFTTDGVRAFAIRKTRGRITLPKMRVDVSELTAPPRYVLSPEDLPVYYESPLSMIMI